MKLIHLATGLLAIGMVGASAAQELGASKSFEKALEAINAGDSSSAVKLLDETIKADPKHASAYYHRGRENFRLANMEQCVQDFDKYVELNPAVASRQWERGIALYYAGKFQAGADQFKLYQTYHDNDVENSVWRYLCMARADKDTELARKAMLPIRNDRRVPMMQVYELYRGNLKPTEVLKAIEEAGGSAEQQAGRTFYADLYLGLYYEANGKHKLARKHLDKAADPKLGESGHLNSYMWDVARIHVLLLKRAEIEAAKKSEDKPN
ncbi:MAG: lipoprotein NlpI [Pirellulaceae bacterium]|jgi:lipoprotein NlpI